MSRPGSTHPQLTFSDIHREELLEISSRREKQCYERIDIEQPHANLVGLALSGGGIRSATFCLGFLQELQRLRLLRIFDYLSTVSGGGYLGGWWSAWLSRKQEEKSQRPRFVPEDIGNSVNLLRRIATAEVGVAEDFRVHLKRGARGRKLLDLARQPDLAMLATRLYEPLANELTAYVEVGAAPAVQWQRRMSLIDTFPCELRGLFPPNERNERDRDKDRDVNQRESEGSRCAWKDPIHHLRLFSNYLTPRKGILSADTWRAIAVVSRNLVLTWLVLLPLLVGVMLISQAYLLLYPASQVAFVCTNDCPSDHLMIAFRAILLPVAILLVCSIAMAVAWLLCNRDSAGSLDWLVQTVGLLMLALMLTGALLSIPPLRDGIVDFFHLPDTFDYFLAGDWYLPVAPEIATYVLRLRLIAAGLIILLFILFLMWHWGVNKHAFKNSGSERNEPSSWNAFSVWKREIRRGRFARAQARLLVTTAVVSVVLSLSWLTCFLSKSGLAFPLKVPFALLPVLSVGGSIFTAFRAMPVAEGSRETSRQPSFLSRFVFAGTPPLVIGVLAVLAAWFVHWLLLKFLEQGNQPYGESLFALLDGVPVLLTMLCLGLALYELEDVQWSKVFDFSNLSLSSVVFLCLVMVNVSWVFQVLLRYGYDPTGPWAYLIVSSAIVAILITAMGFKRIIPRDKRRWSFAGAWFGVLTMVSFIIGLLIFLNGTKRTVGRISGALVLTCLALGGGMAFFRIITNRVKNEAGENLVSLRLPGRQSLSERPEALWFGASVCLTLPIAMICFGHYLMWRGRVHAGGEWGDSLVLFPLAVAALLLSMMLLRSLVIQKRLHEAKPIGPWSAGILEWLFEGIKNDSHRRHAYQLLALVAICVVALLDTIMRGLSPFEITTTMGSGPLNWKGMAVAFVVSLPVFGSTVFAIPFDTNSYSRFKGRSRRVLHSKVFLWIVATFCVFFAVLVGLLLPKWLAHVADIPLNTGLTPFLLPLGAGLLLIVLVEIYWGERDNRRSLLLAGLGYLSGASVVFMNVAEASLGWHVVIGLLAAVCVWVAALGWMVDPNAVSMHHFYKGRLVPAYLGASNMLRFLSRNRDITETVVDDDLPLKSLINCDRGGPYHLINTTLNLVAGRDLATAQRSASSFVLSPTYCGSSRTKYCPTSKYMNGQLTLGTAVAASGAAVSPNMGAKKSTAALAMLMTLLNVRLGYWAPTPNRTGWNSAQTRLWPFYLVREFLSQTNDVSDYCYLTDGGHFDNTGLYSLIERGCRFVVLVDCSADPSPPAFEDLGEAIRRCRIDFGTEIDLNLDPFMRPHDDDDKTPPTPPTCFTVGKIKFSPEHWRDLNGGNPRDPQQEHHGIIIYIKPTVIPGVTADVRQYSIENTFFPQQPTTNQWFGEAQFESYRRLGQTCARSAFGHLRSEIDIEDEGRVSTRKVDVMFYRLFWPSSQG